MSQILHCFDEILNKTFSCLPLANCELELFSYHWIDAGAMQPNCFPVCPLQKWKVDKSNR